MWIRTASDKDLEAVQALLVDTWHATYDDIYGADKVDDITGDWHSIEALRQRLKQPNSEFLVADDGKVVGGMAFASMKDDNTLALHQLYVSPRMQGFGIGGQLLEEILSCFFDAKTVELEVEPENKPAVRFYKKYGFAETGSTGNCGKSDSGIKAVVMSRKLAL